MTPTYRLAKLARNAPLLPGGVTAKNVLSTEARADRTLLEWVVNLVQGIRITIGQRGDFFIQNTLDCDGVARKKPKGLCYTPSFPHQSARYIRNTDFKHIITPLYVALIPHAP
eukprot:7347564-Pyramimonas_sp.AAC.1